MKCLKYLLLVIITLSSLSLITVRTSRLSEGINPGKPIPDIKNLENISGSTINLSDLKGQKVLVNFWAAYDANSRRDNVILSKLTAKEESTIKMVSVSCDKSKSVFEKTVAMDGIDVSSQYYAKAELHPELVEMYDLNKGFKNILIDEKGVIIDVNLSPETLNQHLIRN